MSELAGKKIFVVEDESDIAQLICINMDLEGAETYHFVRAETVAEALKTTPPDLVLLDLMLPGLGGLDLCRWIRSRSQFTDLPIMIVTAKGSEENIIQGLEVGADDYITKPFSPKVLIAKAKAVLKRGHKENLPIKNPDTIKYRGIEVCLGRHEVYLNGNKVELRKIEFKLLHALISRPGWVFTRNQLVDVIHGTNYSVTDRSIDFQMVGLRKKLGKAGQYIETVRGIGYRFNDNISNDPPSRRSSPDHPHE